MQRREEASAAELRWYWGEAEGDMGVVSNFEAMRACLELGGPTGGKPKLDLDERSLQAATRERHIRRALERLSAHDVSILAHAFAPGTREIPSFGKATGVVPITRVALSSWSSSGTNRGLTEWLARLVVRVHTGKSNDLARDLALLRAIRWDAERMLVAALRAYAEARGSKPPSGKVPAVELGRAA
jgi:hypothetical protein